MKSAPNNGSCVVWVALLLLLLTWLGFIAAPPFETTSVRKYEACREAFATPLVDHFPNEIPLETADAVFRFFPGYLQGGAYLQLRVIASEEIARNFDSDLREQAIHICTGGGSFAPLNEGTEKYIPTTPFRTNRQNETGNEFPNHFTLFLLHASHYSGGWNHGETKGIAVSLQTNEVIYWAEHW